MAFVELIYVASTMATVAAGMFLMGMGVKAYADTERMPMVHLAVGFSLIVAASLATAAVAFVTGFGNAQQLLALNTGLSTCGYLLLVYSLWSY